VGLGVFPLGDIAAEACHRDRNGGNALPGAGGFIALALVPEASSAQPPRLSISGGTILVEFHLPSGQPGLALRCRLHGNAQDSLGMRRRLNRTLNHRRSGRVIAGMVLLLAMCGWVVGGDEGVQRALSVGAPLPHEPAISPDLMQQQFGAQLLQHGDMPVLFDMLRHICHRAGLRRLPDLYYLPAIHSMNAYALGGPHHSAITVTEGLLLGMTPGEIAGILAHEVAHIRNHDACAMTWAGALQRAIALTSMAGLTSLQYQNGPAAMSALPLAALLKSASAIGQLLWLGLSRIREFDADATALDLIDDPQALVSALHKLERHHTGSPGLPITEPHDNPMRFLRSHPATWERVGILHGLAPAF
jgi:heat shock protein HtpX